jgi:uncharacterized membrane protein YbhN (UPF0104 family)
MPEQPSGTEPRTARSPLRGRVVLSVLALVLFTVAAVLFAAAAAQPGGSRTAELTATAVCLVTAIIAAADLVVLRRRLRSGRSGP